MLAGMGPSPKKLTGFYQFDRNHHSKKSCPSGSGTQGVGEAVPVCDGEIPLRRAGSCDTAKGLAAVATRDRLLGNMNELEGCGAGGRGDVVDSPFRSSQLQAQPQTLTR